MISVCSAPWLFSFYFHCKEDQDQQLPATDLKCGQMCQRICECACCPAINSVCVCVCVCSDSLMEDDTVHNGRAALLSSQFIWYCLIYLFLLLETRRHAHMLYITTVDFSEEPELVCHTSQICLLATLIQIQWLNCDRNMWMLHKQSCELCGAPVSGCEMGWQICFLFFLY